MGASAEPRRGGETAQSAEGLRVVDRHQHLQGDDGQPVAGEPLARSRGLQLGRQVSSATVVGEILGHEPGRAAVRGVEALGEDRVGLGPVQHVAAVGHALGVAGLGQGAAAGDAAADRFGKGGVERDGGREGVGHRGSGEETGT